MGDPLIISDNKVLTATIVLHFMEKLMNCFSIRFE